MSELVRPYWHGEHIIIRSERASDAERKYAEYRDTEARRLLEYWTEPPVMSYAAYAALFTDSEGIDIHGERISLYIDNVEDEFVGWINILNIDWRNGTFLCGWSIFAEYRRRGYGTEAVRIVLDYCFNELRLHKCNSECLASNAASRALHEKLGFRREGVVRESVFLDGAYQDRVLYGLTADEFNAGRSA